MMKGVGAAAEQIRAFWVVAPGSGEIRGETLPSPSADDVVVRTLYTGISRGTESLVFQGRVPPSEYERMRAPFQAGDFPAPVKYGYSNVGRVEAGPPPLIGTHVFGLFPHQTRYVASSTAVHRLPDDVPPARAVLAANVETAVNALWDARPHIGDRVTVVGAGTVGCAAAWLASKIHGCDVQLVDVNAERKEIARALGVRYAAPDAVDGDADVVIHASGSPEGLALSLSIAAFEATVIELSWYGDRIVPVPLGGPFHAKRLRIVSSQVGHVAASQRPRWDTRRRMQFALRCLVDPVLDRLVTGESAFEDMPAVMSALTAAPGSTLCHRIRYHAD